MEKRKEHNLPLFLLFIDYEKAYDNVNRDKLWEMMDNKIPNYLLNTIKCIYRNTKIRIKFNGGISEPIHTNKEVRQGCGLSPVLFNIYINPSAWGHLNPSPYCDVGRLFYGVFKLWSKLQRKK
jgi:hypothetical protein